MFLLIVEPDVDVLVHIFTTRWCLGTLQSERGISNVNILVEVQVRDGNTDG